MEKKNEDYKIKSKTTFDKQAAYYDNTFNGKHAQTLYDKVLQKLNALSYQSILDIGCGTGTLLSQIAANRQNSAHKN